MREERYCIVKFFEGCTSNISDERWKNYKAASTLFRGNQVTVSKRLPSVSNRSIVLPHQRLLVTWNEGVFQAKNCS